ncbi:MAG: type I 3-dehydroquinate dehydratase [Eubacterium sp.]|nr:type I 3-dehydroquinate dehydratase [Eubacterium sp.]
MGEVVVKNFTFGDGTPRICVPLIGRTEDEIRSHANLIRDELDSLDTRYENFPELKVAVIEWRADFFEPLADLDRTKRVLEMLREYFPDRLILFTFRSEEQGGELRHDRVGSNLEPIMSFVIRSGLIDMVDIECTHGNYKIARATTGAHQMGVTVIMSYHDFEKTPHDDEMIEKIRDMEILGGDILKIAVMPSNEFDTRRMMDINKRMVSESYKPIAIIAMGEKGTASRFKCKETGCCMTFATVGQESAPGQMELLDLVALLRNQ